MANSARIDELRKKFDENPRRYFAPLANEYRKAGDLEQAIFICQEYLPQQPGHMSGHIVHGQALYDLGRTDEAKIAFETALSLDPENLIALRHLGDIARQVGDTDSARMWYQRVLEADPRNEEIAQLMISLLSTPEPGSINPAAPTPVASAEPVPSPDSWRSAVPAEASTAGASAALEVEKSEEASVPGPANASTTTAPVSTPAGPQADDDLRRHDQDELLDFDDASIGGLALSEVAPNVQVEPPEPSREEPAERPSEGMPELSSLDVDERSETEPPARADIEMAGVEPLEIDAAFEADPFAIATPAASVKDNEPSAEAAVAFDDAEPEPEVERATDITLGLPDDGLPLTESAEDTTVANATLDGLETFEPGIIDAPEPPASIGTENYFAEDTATAASAAEQAAPDVAPTETEADEPGSFAPAETESDEFGTFATAEPSSPEPSTAETSAAPPPLHTPVWSSVALESIETMIEPLTPPASTPSVPASFDDMASEFENEPKSPRESTQESPVEFAHESAPIDGGHDGREAPESFDQFAADILPAEAAQPFVTETMAELYLEQGHLDSAVDIYRRLVDQRPDDEALASRLRAVEDQLYGAPAAARDEPATAAAGPTIREFLISVFSRTRQPLPDTALAAASGEVHAQPISLAEAETFEDPVKAEEAGLGHPETFEAVAEPAADAPDAFEAYEERTTDFDEPLETDPSEPAAESSVEPASQPVAPSAGMPTPSTAGATVRGSIDALFSGAGASTADTSAAATLADAFSSEAEAPTPPLNGIPAHRATDELSLDHVFKGNTPPRPSTEVDGFSFDQFFAANAEDAPPASNAPSAAEPEAGDDIAQFNAWLNGLKKS